jgi:4-amino-4-deoxy-L-arabinose transferase-like glycosyltransferase
MPFPSTPASLDRRYLALVAVVLLASLAIAWPFAEGGYVDDFSYVHIAKVLADTGRFAYNGWPTAMLGFQVWWAAAWVWLFGFSYTIVRLSTLPFTFGAVAIAYLLARRATLSPIDSLFVGLSLALTPLFFKLVPTFMSDLPSLCFLLASLYSFVRAIEATDRCGARPYRSVGWLVAGTALGIMGGTIRQNVWLAPPVGAAFLIWARGTGRATRIIAVGCGFIGAACLVVGTAWFNDQPYAIPSRISLHVGLMPPLKSLMMLGWKISIQLVHPLMFCLPPLLAARAGSARRARLFWGGSLIVAAALLLTRHPMMRGDTAFGFGSWGGLGQVESVTRRLIGNAILLVRATPVVAAFVVAVLEVRRSGTAAVSAAVRLPPAIAVPLAYLVPYTAVATMAAQTTGGVFERYAIPHIPIMACWFLFVTRRALAGYGHGREVDQTTPRSRWGWGAVVVGAVIAVADLHDCFAVTRARLSAIDHLQRQGVARERIMAGIAIDGWEQIERAGFINDRRIRKPADAYRPSIPDGYPDFPTRGSLSSLVPEYIVTADRTFHPGDGTPFPACPYPTWLPPYGRAVSIHHQPPPVGQHGPGGTSPPNAPGSSHERPLGQAL